MNTLRLLGVGLLTWSVVCAWGCSATVREAPRRTQRLNNLKMLALAYHNYHDSNRRSPTRLEDLRPLLADASEVYQAVQKGEIEVIWGADLKARPGHNVVLAYYKELNADYPSRMVAFLDGAAWGVEEAEFKTLPRARPRP